MITGVLMIAVTIWSEARSEGVNGMNLVAETIQNRARQKRKPPAMIVVEPGQYSCWSGAEAPAIAADPKYLLGPEAHAWGYSVHLARLVQAGKMRCRPGVMYYRDKSISEARYLRLFSRPLVRVEEIGRLVAYKEA